MIYHGSKTVTAAGTAEPLSAASIRCAWITFFSRRVNGVANTGEVRIGGRAQGQTIAPTAIAAGTGCPLSPGDAAVAWPAGPPGMYDLAHVYVDADTSGDGVQYIYGK